MMYKKLLFVTLASVLLGGCTLADLKIKQAATDSQNPDDSAVIATSTPIPLASVDPALQAIPSPGTGTDNTSLETDINGTTILDEDFSDLN